MRGVLLTVSILLWTSASAAQIPDLNGVWGGRDDGGEALSLHFVGSTVVLTDDANTLLADWSFEGGSKVGGTWEFPMSMVALTMFDRRGQLAKISRNGRARTVTAMLQITGPKHRFCIAPRGFGKRLMKKGAPARCVYLNKATPTPKPKPKPAPQQKPQPQGATDCVAKCVQANQMQAVSPEVIEADCRRQCAGK